MERIIKTFVTMATVVGIFLSTKAAMAAPNCNQLVMSWGPDETAHESDPKLVSPQLIRGRSQIKLTAVCPNGPITGLTISDSTFTKGKSQSSTIGPDCAFQDFVGYVDGPKGTTSSVTITDSSGTNLTAIFVFDEPVATQGDLARGLDGKADKGTSWTKPESDDRYEFKGYGYSRPEADNTFARKGEVGGNDGRDRLEGAPVALLRPGYDPAAGGMVSYSHRFGDMNKVGALLTFHGSGYSSNISMRGVGGLPQTVFYAPQSIWTVGALIAADIPLGSSNFVFDIGGGLAYQYLHTSEGTIGNDPRTQQQWFDPAMDDHTALIQGLVSFSYRFGSSPVGLSLGTMPSFQLVGVRQQSGGTATVNQFQAPVYLSLRILFGGGAPQQSQNAAAVGRPNME